MVVFSSELSDFIRETKKNSLVKTQALTEVLINMIDKNEGRLTKQIDSEFKNFKMDE